jgi:tRNA(Ile)-lysidine synthase TilS/MesJ
MNETPSLLQVGGGKPMKPEYWVLSLSGGKDSTALGLEWLARSKADPVTYPPPS